MGVSLITGIAAKEIIVSTMGVLYHTDIETNKNSKILIDKLRNQTYKNGNKKNEKVFSPLVAFGFMMFILIYFPCIAVIVAIWQESGSWKWAIFTIIYTTGLAWLVSFIIYQIGSLF
jgi:ferrous iron transport protein B